MLQSNSWQFLWQFVWQVPLMIVCITGIVVAALLFPRQRTPALIVIVALGVLLLNAVLGNLLTTFIIRGGALEPRQISYVLQFVSFFRTVIHALAVAALTAAAFTGRGPSAAVFDSPVRMTGK